MTKGIGYGWVGAKQRATLDTGLLLMGARIYNPNSGTFTSTDPVYGGNTTTYAYPADPINGSDISGACLLCPIFMFCVRYCAAIAGVVRGTAYAIRDLIALNERARPLSGKDVVLGIGAILSTSNWLRGPTSFDGATQYVKRGLGGFPAWLLDFLYLAQGTHIREY